MKKNSTFDLVSLANEMQEKQEQAINYLDRMTFVNDNANERMLYKTGDKMLDVSLLVYDAFSVNPCYLSLFDLNFKSGYAKIQGFNANLKGVNSLPFALEIAHYWYYLEKVEVDKIRDLVSCLKPEDLNDEHKLRYNILYKRINACKPLLDQASKDVSEGAKNVVKALRKAPIESYSDDVQEKMQVIIKELTRLHTQKVFNDDINVKNLRVMIGSMDRYLFPINGITVTKCNLKCTAETALEVYACFNDGVKTDKKYNLVNSFKKDNKVVSDIMLRFIEGIQIKNTLTEKKASELDK